MNMEQRKNKGKDYLEWELVGNLELSEFPKWLVVQKTKLQGVPPSRQLVFASEEKKEAEQEIARLRAMYP
jgi:hypothetical protein